MSDVLGYAMWDYYNNKPRAKLWIHNTYGPKEDMPVDTYFRSEANMPPLEKMALNACTGKVLDIGAGAGSHALTLQQKRFDVTALDSSPKAAEVMKQRGVRKIICGDALTYAEKRFDTVLMLMNGIGLVGNIEGLRLFLLHVRKLLYPGGQLIFDSSNVAYLYDGKIPQGKYYGEITYAYHYKQKRSGWFTWLYIDKNTLTDIVIKDGWKISILYENAFDHYLAKLTLV
jgi:SAM-dependent methyltransferase